jgi:hypothetical protein
MIFTKQQYLTTYIFEFLMNQNFTNEICLSKLPIFTSIPCSYPYPTRTRFPSTRTQVWVRVPDPRVAVLYCGHLIQPSPTPIMGKVYVEDSILFIQSTEKFHHTIISNRSRDLSNSIL